MLPPGCDHIGCSSTPVRQSYSGVPLHVVKVSNRAPRSRGQQFTMPIYSDAHGYWKQRRRILLLCKSCGQYCGACHWSPTNHWLLSRSDYGNATLSGLPDYQFRHLQSVINVAARSIFNLRWSDHVTPAWMELDWLSAVNRVDFKVVTLIFRCLLDLALPYLSSSLLCVADMDSICRLRSSADTDILLVPLSRLFTVGDRSFPVTGPRTRNNLPASIRSAPSLLSFERLLKTCLFSHHYTWHCLS